MVYPSSSWWDPLSSHLSEAVTPEQLTLGSSQKPVGLLISRDPHRQRDMWFQRWIKNWRHISRYPNCKNKCYLALLKWAPLSSKPLGKQDKAGIYFERLEILLCGVEQSSSSLIKSNSLAILNPQNIRIITQIYFSNRIKQPSGTNKSNKLAK